MACNHIKSPKVSGPQCRLPAHLAESLVLAAACCHTLVSACSVPDTSAQYALPSLPIRDGALTSRRRSAGCKCKWRSRCSRCEGRPRFRVWPGVVSTQLATRRPCREEAAPMAQGQTEHERIVRLKGVALRRAASLPRDRLLLGAGVACGVLLGFHLLLAALPPTQ